MSTSIVYLNMLNLIHCFQQIHNFYSPPVYVHLHLVFNILICFVSTHRISLAECLIFDIDQSHIVTFGISLLEQLMH